VLLPEKLTEILASEYDLEEEMFVAKYHIDDDFNLEINFAFMYYANDSFAPFYPERVARNFYRDIDGYDEKHQITMSGINGMEYIKKNEQVPVRILRILENKSGDIYILMALFKNSSYDNEERINHYYTKFFDSFKVRE
jgi:hypothetical protein